jgi:glycosyltransferase involved in cell wall biosynthesis
MRKKVLVIGQSFHLKSGGGITISNLFKNWEKDKLAVAASKKSIDISEIDICENLYILGNNERKTLWPINLFEKNNKSGTIIPVKQKSRKKSKIKTFKNGIFDNISKIFFFILNFFGLYHFIFKLKISRNFLNWFDRLNPDFIYCQLSTYELILFIKQIKEVRSTKLIIHIMDDWPTTIAKFGLLQKYWKYKIDKEFRLIIGKADLLFSISEGMQKEYKIRYGKNFKPYHNPIDLKLWSLIKENPENTNIPINIVYTGRIGTANNKSIEDLCKVINNLNNEKVKYNLNIYTPDFISKQTKKFKKNNGINIYPPLHHSQMPLMLNMADVLFLPLDFDKKGYLFSKLSMPTKASEYMISGTPILIYAPLETALVKHSEKYGWAYSVKTNNLNLLSEGIIKISQDKQLRKNLSYRSYNFSKMNYNAENIRTSFESELN